MLVLFASSTSGDQHLCKNRCSVQTTTPSRLGASENGW